MSDDVMTDFESLIAAAEEADRQLDQSPWQRSLDGTLAYQANTGLLTNLLTGPLREGVATQTGRFAKGFDAWMSYELRRAAFQQSEVWPRNTTPRVSSPDLDELRQAVSDLTDWVDKMDAKADVVARRAEDAGNETAVEAATKRLNSDHARRQRNHARRQQTHQRKTAEAAAAGKPAPNPIPALELPDRIPAQHDLLPGLRAAINRVASSMPHQNATTILGRFYVKQVDVMVSSWDRGPDVLISGKTMFSSFANNTKNRYEETLGEASNLRDRYPLASMGYAFIVSDDIFKESGTYARLQDLLLRTRKPDGPYDATMLLIATWDDAEQQLTLTDPLTYPDPRVSGQQPPVDLSASRFFTDLLNTVIANTPVGIHQPVRELRNGTPTPGGAPDLAAAAQDDDSVNQ